MSQNNVLRSLQSFALFPIFAANLITPSVGADKLPTAAVLTTPEIRPLLVEASDNQQKVHDEKVAKMRAYFADKNLPMADYAEELVYEAEKNGLDWTLLGAISMIESTGCKFYIKSTNNCFGWGSGTIRFESVEEAIAKVGWNLGGNNPATAKYYKDKTLQQIINIYNPPHIKQSYSTDIRYVMQSIKDYKIDNAQELALATS